MTQCCRRQAHLRFSSWLAKVVWANGFRCSMRHRRPSWAKFL